MSETRASLFVLDRGALITLAAADSLDCLLYRQVPVVIPDAAFYEATRDSAKLGAQSIIDWVKAHHTQIEIAVTNAYLNFDAARSVNPRVGTQSWGTGSRRGYRGTGADAGRRQGYPALQRNRRYAPHCRA